MKARPLSRILQPESALVFVSAANRSCKGRFYTDLGERELGRCLTSCAFVVMQTEDQKYDCELAQFTEQGLDIHAIGLDTQKRHGEVAEAKFLAKASSMGFGVAKPWGDERYDFILDSGHFLWRGGVKFSPREGFTGVS